MFDSKSLVPQSESLSVGHATASRNAAYYIVVRGSQAGVEVNQAGKLSRGDLVICECSTDLLTQTQTKRRTYTGMTKVGLKLHVAVKLSTCHPCHGSALRIEPSPGLHGYVIPSALPSPSVWGRFLQLSTLAATFVTYSHSLSYGCFSFESIIAAFCNRPLPMLF